MRIHTHTYAYTHTHTHTHVPWISTHTHLWSEEGAKSIHCLLEKVQYHCVCDRHSTKSNRQSYRNTHTHSDIPLIVESGTSTGGSLNVCTCGD